MPLRPRRAEAWVREPWRPEDPRGRRRMRGRRGPPRDRLAARPRRPRERCPPCLVLLRLGSLVGLRGAPGLDRLTQFPDAGALPSPFPEVVQLGAADPPARDDLDLRHGG